MNEPVYPPSPPPSAGASDGGDRSLYRHLGGTIRGLRQKDHLTIADVAAQVGISRGMLSTIENGQAATSLWSECESVSLTAERTLDPARMLTESLGPRPELENSQGQTRS